MAEILKKKIAEHIELFVVEGASITFNVKITGLDPLRPTNTVSTPVGVETARLLLETEWEVLPLPKKKE